MGAFEDLMEQFRNPGDTGLPDNFADELTSAYQEDLSIRDAAVTEKENLLAERQKEIDAAKAETIRLKAVNYDLIKAAPKAGNPADDNKPDGGVDQGGVDSLFE
jgi:hypothetical protein